MDNGIDRVDGGWDVRSMRGSGITEMIIGSVLRLHAGPDGIEVHCPAELTTSEGALAVHAATRTHLDRLPLLLGQVIAEVHAGDAGGLRVRFANEWRLDVPVSTGGPGWLIHLRGRHFISSLPGGGLKLPG
ncbi:DUF6188 family protein [Streptomyces sp. NPDC088923]|uniref:DUF6188 family protein n=1 Tax=Streptomyces sp. NPDC088923 TaxID=3365913 RepID=UPI0037F885D0